jgi:hypothetical protein
VTKIGARIAPQSGRGSPAAQRQDDAAEHTKWDRFGRGGVGTTENGNGTRRTFFRRTRDSRRRRLAKRVGETAGGVGAEVALHVATGAFKTWLTASVSRNQAIRVYVEQAMARYDASDLLTDAILLRRVAREMLGLYDAGAVRRLKEEAGQAARQGDSVSASAWLDVAELVQDLLLKRAAEAAEGRPGKP